MSVSDGNVSIYAEDLELSSSDLESGTVPTAQTSPTSNNYAPVNVEADLSPEDTDDLVQFPQFKNISAQPLVLMILGYLTSYDLCKLGEVSRSMYLATCTPILWKNLIRIDFRVTDIDEDFAAQVPDLTSMNVMKPYYISRFQDVNRHIHNAKIARSLHDRNMRREQYHFYVQTLLDLLLVRILTPLPAIGTFLSIYFVAAKLDGSTMPMWYAFSPALLSIAYIYLCIVINFILYYCHYYKPSSMFAELYPNLRGPIFQLMYHLHHRRGPCRMAFVTFTLFSTQVLFLALKLTHSISDFHWAIVFLPIWLLYLLFGLSYTLQYISFGNFVSIATVVLLPHFILFVALTLKLEGMEHHNDVHSDLQLHVILTPFWILEGILLSSVIVNVLYALIKYATRYFLSILNSYRHWHNIEDIIDRAVMLLTGPVVIFHVLLSLRDAHPKQYSNVEVVSPLLVICGIVSLALLFLGATTKTVFQETREMRRLEAAGMRSIFDV